MRTTIQVISWFMLVFGAIATFALISEANSGVTGNGLAIAVGLVWIVQSVLILVYLRGDSL
jgi:hypothetical protein